MLHDAPPLCVSINVHIVIPFDTGLDGEVDITFLFFTCFELGVKSVSECMNPRWSTPEDSPSDSSEVKRSSYNVLKLFLLST